MSLDALLKAAEDVVAMEPQSEEELRAIETAVVYRVRVCGQRGRDRVVWAGREVEGGAND